MRTWIILLTVTVASHASAIDFENDIIPVLTKAGCNAGACHGAAVGRGGFRLSLYGGDPSADFRSIVRELQGRRVNLADPEESLLVLKPTETIEHGGGQRLEYDQPGVERILDWIQQGARWSSDAEGERPSRVRLQRLDVTPQRTIVSWSHPRLQLHAVASFSDGTQRDVTQWTVFTPEDVSAIDVDETEGVATVNRRGRHIIVARYLNEVVPIEVIVPLADLQPNQDSETVAAAPGGLIDLHLSELLNTLRIPLSPGVNDATFLRRISLDLTGRLPEREAVDEFAANADLDRREQLVDRLLESPEFNDFWTLQLAKLLRVKTQPQDSVGAETYHRWLHEQLAQHIGYDQIARSVLTALGDTHEIGPANFYRTVVGPREQAELASEVFMGNRLRCANCHNHPLDRWTQDDYHGLAAIFATVRSGKIVSLDRGGIVIHPKTGDSALPRIPGERFLDQPGDAADLSGDSFRDSNGRPSAEASDSREALADWLVDRDNPFFSRAIVNRLWKAMMGRGLVEPADDLRATNPATHPALLDQLAEDFVAHGYDLRHTLRSIALSQAYARSANGIEGNESDDRFYSRFLRRGLPAEVLSDAISDVLELPESYGDQPLGTRAVALVDPQTESRSLDILGRCDRVDTCETDSGTSAGGLPLRLHLFNGELLNRRISAPGSRLKRLTQAGMSPLQIVDEFYVAALQRHPHDAELEYWQEQWNDETDPNAALEDFVWSLLTCNEFITNH